MDSKHRQELLDQYEEATMMLLMDEYAEADGARLLQQFEEAEKNGQVPDVPAELDEKCRKLIEGSFAKQERKNHIFQLGRILGKVAIYALVLLGLMTTMVLSVDALRVPVLNFFLEQSERYSTVIFNHEIQADDPAENPLSERMESWLPDDYELVVEEYINGETFLVYQNDIEKIISLNITYCEGKLFVDTEDSAQKETTINDYPAVFVDKDGYRLMWTDEKTNLAYDFYANGLDAELFEKIAYRISSHEEN